VAVVATAEAQKPDHWLMWFTLSHLNDIITPRQRLQSRFGSSLFQRGSSH